MDKQLLLLITMATAGVSARNSVFGTIKENTTWFLSPLSVYPAMTADLEYEIEYPAVPGRTRPIITYYYNGQQSPNLVEKCERNMFGQLRNEDLGVPLNARYRKSFCYLDNVIWRCKMKTKIQDFEPKSYSFSLCNECGKRGNLYGLSYNVTIYGETNNTRCVDLEADNRKKKRHAVDRCERYYQYAAIPNQIGNTDIDTAMFQLTHALSVMDNLIDLVKHNGCLKQLYQLACLVMLPECLPEANKIILPCREYCEKVILDCVKMAVFEVLIDKLVLNCDYLPLRNSSECYSRYETCGPPPSVGHGTSREQDLAYGYSGQVVQYVCADGMHMTGSCNSTCLPSGEWTDPPKCRRLSLVMIICIGVGALTALILFITIATICVREIRERKRRQGPLVAGTLGNDPSDDHVPRYDGNGLGNDPVVSNDVDPLMYNQIQYE